MRRRADLPPAPDEIGKKGFIMNNTITISIFVKKIKKNDGGDFNKYLSTLTRTDGSKFGVEVKFSGCSPIPANKCPCNVTFERANANLDTNPYDDPETDETKIGYILWLKEYGTPTPFVDHSLDDIV